MRDQQTPRKASILKLRWRISARARRGPAAARRRRLDADLITREDVVALLEQCEASPTGIRNRTLIVLLWRTGLRISEALALVEKDIACEQGVLVVQRGKGGRRRVIGLDEETIGVVCEWVSLRASTFAPAPDSPLFCTRGGRPIDASNVRRLLPRLARAAGISKRVHSHALRHLFALELQAEGAPMTTIRDLLGHASLGTTDVYLRRLGASPAIDFARRRRWNGQQQPLDEPVGHASDLDDRSQ